MVGALGSERKKDVQLNTVWYLSGIHPNLQEGECNYEAIVRSSATFFELQHEERQPRDAVRQTN